MSDADKVGSVLATRLTRTEPLFETETADPGSQYDPLPSVWYGEDYELLEKLLLSYPRKHPKRILDATVNAGRFWRNSQRAVIGMDIDFSHKPTLVADNTAMPFRDSSFDVIVYDPPHIPNQGKDKLKDFGARFGLVRRSSKENHYTFTFTFPPFLSEAYRVLHPEGILFAKIADYVHHHRYQWAHIELVNAATTIGFRACDCIIKVRKGPIIDRSGRRLIIRDAIIVIGWSSVNPTSANRPVDDR